MNSSSAIVQLNHSPPCQGEPERTDIARPTTHAIARFSKRIFDVVLSLAGLLVLAPLFLLIAILIKLESSGPVFFCQIRVGQGRRLFRMWKFRKMHDKLPEQIRERLPDLRYNQLCSLMQLAK